jgi:predicted phage replisome organizer
MSEVKWIKLATDIFNNRKIKQIMKMPEGDAILVMWVQILCLAGTINNNGVMILTRDIPYTEETLATEFDRPVQLVRLALQTFCFMGMMELHDNIYMVTNWERYQNVAGMDKIREHTRLRTRAYRERLKLAPPNNDTCDATVTSRNVTVTPLDIDIRDKNKRKRKNTRDDDLLDSLILDEVDEAMEAFREFRAKKKSPLTRKAEVLIRNKLETMAPNDKAAQAKILNQSTEMGWTGIYPLKAEEPVSNGPKKYVPEGWE